MNAIRASLVVCLVLCLSVSTVSAQVPHVVDQATLDRLVSDRIAQDQADRAAVQRLLNHPEVRTIASHFGIDLTDAAAAVSTLSGPELGSLATQAQHVENALAGGQSSITISTTTIIIGLLVLILLIVAI